MSRVATDDTSNTEPDPEPSCAICRDVGFLRNDAPVGHPDFGTLAPCSCRATSAKESRVERLRRLSQLGPLARQRFDSLADSAPSTDPPAFASALERARAYAAALKGWFVLIGPAGSGKTSLAAAIANERVEQGEPALFIVVPDFLDHLRATYAPTSDVTYDEMFESVRNAPFLILDDLGAQSGTPWADEKLFQVLNHRYNAELPTVITSSLRLVEMDDRSRSRLSNPELSQVCQVADWPGDSAARFGTLPVRLREMTFATFDPRGGTGEPEHADNLRRALQLARPFAQNPRDWIVFIGEPGSGKTHLAAAIANESGARGEPFCFAIVPDLLDHLRSSFAPDSTVRYDQVFEDVRNAPLLILDDLGAQSTTPWAQEKLFQILNHRYNASLATVITTNVPLEHHERRICSRMLDQRLSTVFAITAPPYRLSSPSPPRTPNRRPRSNRE
jgi:DNA replication protein DnaC